MRKQNQKYIRTVSRSADGKKNPSHEKSQSQTTKKWKKKLKQIATKQQACSSAIY